MGSQKKESETGKYFIRHLIPNGKAVYTVRIPGTGSHMLAITEESEDVKLLNLRDASQNEKYNKEDVEKAFGKIFFNTGTWKESWEKEYGEILPAEKMQQLHRCNRKRPNGRKARLLSRRNRNLRKACRILESVSKTQESVPESKETVSKQ